VQKTLLFCRANHWLVSHASGQAFQLITPT
jgi:hypothetical protein